MKARDIDEHDATMLRRLGEHETSNGSAGGNARGGRIIALADFISRHHAELAECEHGALKGRCEVDPCEMENFESDHVVNRAIDVLDQCEYGEFGEPLTDGIEMTSFSVADFRELTRLAWIGARVSAATSTQSTPNAPPTTAGRPGEDAE